MRLDEDTAFVPLTEEQRRRFWRGIRDAALIFVLIASGVCAGNLASVTLDEWRTGVVYLEDAE